jgi:hypothetical protein
MKSLNHQSGTLHLTPLNIPFKARRAQLFGVISMPVFTPNRCNLGERPYKSVAMPAGQMAVTVTPFASTSFEKATEKLFRYDLLAL